jgi:acyl-CoA hydrolase
VTEPKTTAITLFEEIFPGDTNAYGTAFGGKILALMDRAAGLAASRFACADFVTASLDSIDFRAPVRQGEIAEVAARVVYTSKRTCGVQVRVWASDKSCWERRPCCVGVIFMVSIGEDGTPQEIPQLTPESDEGRAAWADVEAVHQRMLARRKRG